MKTNYFIILLIVFTIFKVNTATAQIDTTKYPIFDFAFESGVFFPQSDVFLADYNSNSFFNYGFKLKAGFSTWKVLPWYRVSFYKTQKDTSLKYVTIEMNKSFVRKIQNAVGITIPVNLGKDNCIQFKYGGTYNLLLEEASNLDTKAFGFIVSAGYMKRFSSLFSFYIDITYDYTKTDNKNRFNDWSGISLLTGFSVNIAQ